MVRKKRLPKRRALVKILKLGTFCLIVGLPCIAIFQGIQPNSGKKMAEGHKVFQMQGQFQGILDASSLIKPKPETSTIAPGKFGQLILQLGNIK